MLGEVSRLGDLRGSTAAGAATDMTAPAEAAVRAEAPTGSSQQAAPGQAAPGQAVPGQAVPGQAASGQAASGQAVPGQAVPGQAVPGQAVPGQAVPGQAAAQPFASPPAEVTADAIGAAAAGQASAENFPVALRLLPARYRGHLTAVYGFARAVDDMGDEAPPGERMRLLDELEADLARLYQSPPGPAPAIQQQASQDRINQNRTNQDQATQELATQEPASQERAGAAGPQIGVVRALGPAVASCAIPEQPFRDLIQANRQDQVVTRYQTFADLLAYCEPVRQPGRPDRAVRVRRGHPDREALSDKVCTALQLAEHWQDVAEDFRAGRIYLPGEDMDRFGVTEADLAAAQAAPRSRALIEFEVNRARRLLDEGAPLVGNLRGAARVAVAGYVAGGRAALAAIAGGWARRTALDPAPTAQPAGERSAEGLCRPGGDAMDVRAAYRHCEEITWSQAQ